MDRDLPPETCILPGASRAVAPTSSVSVASSQPGSSFSCRIDLGTWAACGSPVRLRDLAEGDHALEVRATDVHGNTDATPARTTLAVAASPYARAVLADEPLSYWRLGEGSGVHAQDEAGAHDGGYGRQGWYTTYPGLLAPGALIGDPNTAATFDDRRQVDVGDAHDFTGRVPFSL